MSKFTEWKGDSLVSWYTRYSLLESRPTSAISSTSSFKYSKPEALLTEEYQRTIGQLFVVESSPYKHRHFKMAASIFDVMKHSFRWSHIPKFHDSSGTESNPDLTATSSPTTKNDDGDDDDDDDDDRFLSRSEELSEIQFESKTEKRIVYQLAFQTLKYQRCLQKILENAHFFEKFPEHRVDSSLVTTILYDYQDRRFQLLFTINDDGGGGGFSDPRLRAIEASLRRSKTRLSAALARCRIEARAPSVDQLLPPEVRLADELGRRMKVCAWINFNRTSKKSVVEDLTADGLRRVHSFAQLSRRTFKLDAQCHDVIYFPSDLLSYLEDSHLVRSSCLVLQDKSSSVIVHSVRSLINLGDDILCVNVGSGIDAGHLASLTVNSETTVFCLGVRNEKQRLRIGANLERLGAASRVKLIDGDFLELCLDDVPFRDIKVVLVSALCTKSAIVNPVNFLIQEDDVPRVQGVVYSTRSRFSVENESVVGAALDGVSSSGASRPPSTGSSPFRLSPPVLAFSEREVEAERPIVGKYLSYSQSTVSSGCFVAIIAREADDPQELAKDIIAKAAARGIIKGVGRVTSASLPTEQTRRPSGTRIFTKKKKKITKDGSKSLKHEPEALS